MSMPPNAAEPEQEIKQLQRCVSDLVSVLALPAVLNNSEPRQILETFLDALLKMVDLDFVYARARVASDEAPLEVLRTADSAWAGRGEIHQALRQWFGEDLADN